MTIVKNKYWVIALPLLLVLILYRFFFPSQNTLDTELLTSLRHNNSDSNKTSLSLIEKGADTNFTFTNGNSFVTPLKLTAISNNTLVANALIEHGANVNQVTGQTSALDIACSYRNLEITELLIQHGAVRNSTENYDIKDKNLSLHCKAKDGNNAIN